MKRSGDKARFRLKWQVLMALCFGPICLARQTEVQERPDPFLQSLKPLEILEAGLATQGNVPLPLFYLGAGEYGKALESLSEATQREFPWLKSYLKGLISVSFSLKPTESSNFILYIPEDHRFLADYALPTLEEVASHMEKGFKFKPKGKIRIEIYPTKEDFSFASTLSSETLKRSGAIGICKFHRLMILSPRALPLGYRWLDSLSHEYIHLLVNELSWTHAELWLHEGTAKYFDTSYRISPPAYLIPDQKTKLLDALRENKLIEFKRMSPSLVYLKDQDEVSLAFSQVSYALGNRIEEKGTKPFVDFLRELRRTPFKVAFASVYGMTPEEFEVYWQSKLAKENWEKTRGALSDEVRFERVDEESLIGADTQGKVRLGDRMRMKGYFKAALIEYDKALKEEPDNAVILLKTARTHLVLQDSESAIQKLKKAIHSNPNYGTSYIELAKLVKAEEAVPLLLDANSINPFDPEIHFLLGKAYEELGEVEKAKREGDIYDGLKGGNGPY